MYTQVFFNKGQTVLGVVFFLNSILLGIGLAMDAFSVSMANGLNEPDMKKNRMCFMAGTYGFFQFAMPVIGWFLVKTAVGYFKIFEKAIPWIALILLSYIGGKMLLEGIKNKESSQYTGEILSVNTVLLQGIATSIDALSVGFTIVKYDFYMALTASVIIALVTFVICICGLSIGKKFGTKLEGKASVLGGVILISIGLEIFIRSLL